LVGDNGIFVDDGGIDFAAGTSSKFGLSSTFDIGSDPEGIGAVGDVGTDNDDFSGDFGSVAIDCIGDLGTEICSKSRDINIVYNSCCCLCTISKRSWWSCIDWFHLILRMECINIINCCL